MAMARQELEPNRWVEGESWKGTGVEEEGEEVGCETNLERLWV